MHLFRSALATVALLVVSVSSAFAQTLTWTGAGDGTTFGQAANWSPAAVPGATNDLVIPAGGGTITAAATHTIRSLTTSRAVQLSTSSCSTLTITNGLTFGPGGSIATNALGCGTMLVFNGTQTVSGTGTITLNQSGAGVQGAGSVVTLGPGITVNAATNSSGFVVSSGNTLINQGTMQATAASRTLTVAGPGTFTNENDVLASGGGTVTISVGTFTNAAAGSVEVGAGSNLNITSAAWTNNGTYTISGGNLSLGGTYAAFGTVSRTGGTLTLNGTFTGPTLTANATLGSIILGGLSLSGTVLNAADGQGFSQSGNVAFNGVTLNAPFSMSTSSCVNLTVTGGLAFGPGGSISTNSLGCGSMLIFSGTQTVSGTSTITLNQSGAAVQGAGSVVTLGPGITVNATTNGSTFAIGAGNTLINQGVMQATAAARTLTISGAGTFINENDVLATGGGTVAISAGTFNNAAAGSLAAPASSSVNLTSASWTNSGVYTLSGGSMSLGGTYGAFGTINRTGGTLTLNGTFTGPTLTANATFGSITLGGITLNGTVLNTADGQNFLQSGNIVFNGVTLNAPFTMSSTACVSLTVTGGLTFGPAGSISTNTLGCGSMLIFNGTQTVSGPGTITLSNSGIGVQGTNATVTLSPSVTISATVNAPTINIAAGNTLINQGVLQSSTAGRTLTINGAGTFVNESTVRATGGGGITIAAGAFTNAAGATLESAAGSTVNVTSAAWTNNGTYTISGGNLSLGGTYSAFGTVNRTGGTLTLNGTFTGPTLTANATLGTITLGALTLTGTVLNNADGQTFLQSGNVAFNAVTLNAPFTMSSTACVSLTVTGGLTFGPSGSIATNTLGCGSMLIFNGTQAVSGVATITLNNSGASVQGTNATLTLGPGITVNATTNSSAFSVSAGNTLVNQGAMQATAANRTLTVIGAGAFTNSGVIASRNSANVNLDINTLNNGTIVAGTGGNVTLAANRTLTNPTAGTIEIEGTSANPTTGFGHIRVSGTLIANGNLLVSYPNGHVPGCHLSVPIVTALTGGVITGTFEDQTGPDKPSPFAVRFGFLAGGSITFSSTNQADVGSAGGEQGADGLLDNNDFIVFINLFFALDPLADRGSAGGEPGFDGLFDNNDFIVFINQFFSGCG